MQSPNELLNYPGESLSALTRSLKYSSPDPLDPPDDKGTPCPECQGEDVEGCETCGGTGWLDEDDLKEMNEEDRTGEE